MDDAMRKWLEAARGAAKNHTASVRGEGLRIQCNGCGAWFNVLTVFLGIGVLCVECAEGFRSIVDRRRL